ncbi:hypothetical protein D9599_24140 [Roseomonas sp. KE2513]|uniref:hypothetical protein n=1 Tax=Roseomonas sp. KE2513 TaxID=2479202 RepID=UPI0018E013EA|nr:hypothetical protein [Roseomonas sp. KE2513]MBI0538654.1 hypothetical protein [Roseomonas sp. KE2513]
MEPFINPADAPAGVDGVFHPPYIAAHLAVTQRMARPRLLVVKGGGGEAERSPAKPVAAHLMTGAAVEVLTLPALSDTRSTAADFAGVWQGSVRGAHAEGTIIGTIALGLLAMGTAGGVELADAEAERI